MAYSACGVPTSLSITNNNDNTVTLSCKAGTDGTDNPVAWVQFFITCDGATPSKSSYKYTYTIAATAGSTVTQTISFAGLPQTVAEGIFGSTCIGVIRFIAITKGAAGASYDSAISTVATKNFTWRGSTKPPVIISPKNSGEITGIVSSYRVTWKAGQGGINNNVLRYTVRVHNLTTNSDVITYSSTNLYCDIFPSDFVAGNTYCFYITTVGSYSNFNGPAVASGMLTVKTIDKFSNINLIASDGNTVPSTDIPGIKTYVNIGSGNVLKLSWDTPIATNNEVDYYSLNISCYDDAVGSTVELYSGSVGKVNEFYIDAAMLSNITTNYCPLYVYLVAYSKYGATYNGISSTLTVYVSHGCGTYVKVEKGYSQPIMKRALAFSKLDYVQLFGSDGKALAGADGLAIYAKSARAQDTYAFWTLMQEFYSKDATGNWLTSDIKYEVLTDSSGNIITDLNNEPIYVL